MTVSFTKKPLFYDLLFPDMVTETNDHVQLAHFRFIQGILPCDISFESDFIWLQSTTRQATNNWLLNGEAHMCTAGLRTAAVNYGVAKT